MKYQGVIKKLLVFILVIAFNINTVYSNNDEYNILVLHSYHQGLEWTDNISSGIQEVFKDRTDVNLIFEYLDTKRNFSEDYYKALYNLYHVKAKQIPFDVIIISDNAAYNFMKLYGNEFYPNIPILFCGVNNLDTVELKKYPNFVGVGENADHFGTISSIEKIFPNRKKILIINDYTLTGINIKNELIEVLDSFKNRLNFEFVTYFTLKSIQDKVKSLDDNYAIYLLVINRDKNGNFISYRKGINKIKEVSNVPIFGSWDFYEGKGIVGGKITRGTDQGKYVAEIAKQILEGKPIESFPQSVVVENKYVFDYNEMVRFGILNKNLPEGSIIINKPELKDNLLKITIGIILVLITFLLFLAIRLKMKKARAIEMEKIIEKRTLELNQTNKELSDIIVKKDKFFSILAHDFRGSVSVFLSYSILLNKDRYIKNEEESVKLRKNLQIAATQTHGVIEDLLYWGVNQFKQKRNIDVTLFNVEDSLLKIIDRFKLNLNNVSFATDFEPDVNLNSDANICQFIFRNIIQNAIKFSHMEGEIKIISKKTDSGVVIVIEDKGIGMDPEIIESIYSKSPIKRDGLQGQKPMGLGLATVLDYLEQIQGSIQIESTPNIGSTFSIRLNNLQ